MILIYLVIMTYVINVTFYVIIMAVTILTLYVIMDFLSHNYVF